jgi:hypothetical protein
MFPRLVYAVVLSLLTLRLWALPTAVTADPISVTATSAVLRGTVNPFSKATTAWFEWGTTTNYGNMTAPTNLPAVFSSFSVSTQLVGLLPRTVYFARVVATNADGIQFGQSVRFVTLPEPLFAEVNNPFSGAYNGMQVFADYDEDGWMDLLLAGTTNVFEGSSFTHLYRNTGSNFVFVPSGHPGLLQGSMAWADWDRDGYLDYVIMGRRTNAAPYVMVTRNNGDGTFNFGSIALPAGQDTAAAWGDFDNDGDPDLFLAGEAGNPFLANLYANNLTAFGLTPNTFQPIQNASAAWGDYDSDGDLDLVAAGDNRNGVITVSNLFATLYRNDSGHFIDSGVPLPGMNAATLSWFDFDNDGDLDLLMNGTIEGHVTLIYRNDGGSFTALDAGFPDVNVGGAAWVDFNNDGWSDVLITGVGNTPQLSGLFLNRGDGTFQPVTNSGLARISSSHPALADIDNDGRIDVLIAGATNGFNGVTRLFRNIAPIANTPPTSPSNLTVEVASDGRSAILRWDAATDAQTPALGITYNVRVGTNPGAVNIVSPHSDSVTGRRFFAEMGNAQHRRWLRLTGLTPGAQYYWSVQAVDNGFAASQFAEEKTFDAIGPANFTSVTRNGDDVIIICRGTPGVRYGLEATSELMQPASSNIWSQATSSVADGSGLVQFAVNRNASSKRFFRTVYPGI